MKRGFYSLSVIAALLLIGCGQAREAPVTVDDEPVRFSESVTEPSRGPASEVPVVAPSPPPPPPPDAVEPVVGAPVTVIQPAEEFTVVHPITTTTPVSRVQPVFSWDDVPLALRLPMFESPQASYQLPINRSIFDHLSSDPAQPPSLYTVHDFIRTTISQPRDDGRAGYDSATLGFENGFAILTTVERINANGASRLDNEGDRVSLDDVGIYSFQDYISYLLTQPKRHARAFAIVVTTDPTIVEPDAPAPSASLIEDQVSAGAVHLPIILDDYAFTRAHNVTLLIYEYQDYRQEGVDTADAIIAIDAPAQITQEKHLKQSQILSGLAP